MSNKNTAPAQDAAPAEAKTVVAPALTSADVDAAVEAAVAKALKAAKEEQKAAVASAVADALAAVEPTTPEIDTSLFFDGKKQAYFKDAAGYIYPVSAGLDPKGLLLARASKKELIDFLKAQGKPDADAKAYADEYFLG